MPDADTSSPTNPYQSPSEGEGYSPDIPAAPPPGTATVWPSVLGVLGIVFGGFGVFGGLYGIVWSLFFLDFFVDAMSNTPGGTISMAPMMRFRTQFVGFSIVGTLIAAGLLALGIGLLRRRPWAARYAFTWAAIKMVFVLAYSVFNFRLQQMQFDNMFGPGGQMGNAPFDATSFGTTVAAIGLVIAIAWGCALPVFLIFWLRRHVIRAEVAHWKSGT